MRTTFDDAPELYDRTRPVVPAQVFDDLALYGLAAAAAMDGDAERAVRLWAAADVIHEAMAAPLSAPEQFIVERFLEPSQAAVADDALSRARAESSSMTVDEAVDYALAGVDPLQD